MADKHKKIGDILAAARRDQNRTIQDSSEYTKISIRYLEAIEAGQPGNLPSDAYFILFARSYAQFLGLDPLVLDEIVENDLDKSPDSSSTFLGASETGTKTGSNGGNFGRSLIYIAVVVFILFAAVIVYTQWFAAPTTDSDQNPQDNVIAIDQQAVETEAAESAIEQPVADYKSPEKLDLLLTARQDVWVVVVRDGDTVLNRQLAPGDVRRWEANYRFLLTLGISTAVELILNGTKLAPLSDQPRTIAGLEINQINYKNFFPRESTAEEMIDANTDLGTQPVENKQPEIIESDTVPPVSQPSSEQGDPGDGY